MRALGLAVLLTVVAWEMPAAAHHSNPMYFDTTRAITLEGKIQRVQWINPHILMFLESKNEKGEMETWILQGWSLNSAMSQVGLRERLHRASRSRLACFPLALRCT